MEAVSYICKGDKYTVVPILDCSSIDNDIETVLDKISGTPIDEYRSAMVESVNQGLAFCVYKNGEKVSFSYSYVNDYKYIGASIYSYGDFISSLITLRTLFEINDAHKIIFVPHRGGLRYFKSMATGPSIRAHYAVGSPVSILRSTIYSKGSKMFNYFGIMNG